MKVERELAEMFVREVRMHMKRKYTLIGIGIGILFSRFIQYVFKI